MHLPFVKVQAADGSATLNGFEAMPSGHKWLLALVWAGLAWATVCLVHVRRRGDQSIALIWLAVAAAVVVLLAVSVVILIVHFVAREKFGSVLGQRVRIANDYGIGVTLFTLLILGLSQLRAGIFGVSSLLASSK
jgi:hypothetical protein